MQLSIKIAKSDSLLLFGLFYSVVFWSLFLPAFFFFLPCVSVSPPLYDFPAALLCPSSASLKFPLFFLPLSFIFSQWSCPVMLWLLRPACFGLRARQRKTHWHLQLPAKQTNEMQGSNERMDSWMDREQAVLIGHYFLANLYFPPC